MIAHQPTSWRLLRGPNLDMGTDGEGTRWERGKVVQMNRMRQEAGPEATHKSSSGAERYRFGGQYNIEHIPLRYDRLRIQHSTAVLPNAATRSPSPGVPGRAPA